MQYLAQCPDANEAVELQVGGRVDLDAISSLRSTTGSLDLIAANGLTGNSGL